jgi:intein/homing endonuclease
VAAFAAVPVAAHEKGGDRAMGIVARFEPERIVVKTSDGHEVPFTVTPETRFVREGKRVRAEDVRVGQRVVVHGNRVGESLQAVEVKLGAAAARTK